MPIAPSLAAMAGSYPPRSDVPQATQASTTRQSAALPSPVRAEKPTSGTAGPTRVLMSADLPTFERPAIATSGGPGGGPPPGVAAAPRKRAAMTLLIRGPVRCSRAARAPLLRCPQTPSASSAPLGAGLLSSRRSARRALLRHRRETERAVRRAHLGDVGLADRALLQRLDQRLLLLLAGLREGEQRLPVGGGLELVLGVDVGELEVDRVARDAVLVGIDGVLGHQVLHLEPRRQDVERPDHLDHLGVALVLLHLRLHHVLGRELGDT